MSGLTQLSRIDDPSKYREVETGNAESDADSAAASTADGESDESD